MLGTKEIKATFTKDLKITKWKELQQVSLKLLVKAFIWLEHVFLRGSRAPLYIQILMATLITCLI